MGLAHPALNTTGKKKGKKKFASAEAKRKALELEKQWEELKKKYPSKPVKTMPTRVTRASTPRVPPGRETPSYPSLNSNEYDCFKKPDKIYTGSSMKGIGTLHKSNAVPIFTDQEAKDQASMRR